MNRTTILLLCSLLLAGCSTLPVAHLVPIEYIIDTQKPMGESFDTTMLWLNNTFISSKNVIQYANKESGIITTRAMERLDYRMAGISGPYNAYMNYTLTIQFKESKARFLFNAVGTTWGEGAYAYSGNPIDQPLFDKFVAFTRAVCDNYSTYIKQGSATW